MSYLSAKLTKHQQDSLNIFDAWLNKKYDGTPFVLSGFAGSGKTFLSMRFLQLVEEKRLCWTIVAPTHKAVEVLNQALNCSELTPTWYPSTIHRLLRLKLKRKGDLEVCEPTEKTPNSLEKLKFVLVDEASMVDSNLLEIVLNCAQPFKTRLVFVGDCAQLPPVGEAQSPVFSIKRSIRSELREVVRHQGPVLHLANKFRNGYLPCSQPPCFPDIETELGSIGSLDKGSWLLRAMKALKTSAINDNPDTARILCFTNRTLEKLVPHARRAIHGEMADQLPVLPGEVLMSRTAVMTPASVTNDINEEEPGMILGSNRELVVIDVIPESCDLSDFGLIGNENWSVPVIETLIANVRSGGREYSLRLLPPLASEPRKLFDLTLKMLRNKAKDSGKQNGKSFWRQFFLVRDAFASLGPASVLTVHRSQGSSFEEVFVASDVFWPNNLVLRRQLIYVAVSRAKKGVWIEGNTVKNTGDFLWQKQIFEIRE